MTEERIAAVARALAGTAVAAVERHLGGGNNRLYRVRTAAGASYALKEYPRRQGDSRDRLSAEFGALDFLGRCGVTVVPRALAADRDNDCALYEWIEGDPVRSPDERDVDAAVGFARDLHALRMQTGADALPLASEACLSAAELVAQVTRRAERLRGLASSEPRLAAFLDREFDPLAGRIEAWARRGYDAQGWAFDVPVGLAQRTLSPSDFGFHNAIRRPDGNLAFVDFEYFGWDDPVKLTADFMQHPGMRLSPGQYDRFLTGVTQVYGGETAYAARLALIYPLYGLRWCMILLNEFLPERWEARRRAGIHADREAATSAQLEKARNRLAAVREYLMEKAT